MTRAPVPALRYSRLLACLVVAALLGACAGRRVVGPRPPAPEEAARGEPGSTPREEAGRMPRTAPAPEPLPRLAAPVPRTLGPDALLPASGQDEIVARYGELALTRGDLFERLREREPAKAQELLELALLDARVHELAVREGIHVPRGELELAVQRELARVQRAFARRPEGAADFEAFLRQSYGLGREDFEARAALLAYRRLMRAYAVRYALGRRGALELQLFVGADAERAATAREAVAAGGDFAAIARQDSVHPSAAQGGRLPPLPPDLEHPAIRLAAGLAAGALSPAGSYVERGVASGTGFVRVLGRVAPDPRPFAAVVEELRRGLAMRPVQPHEIALFVSSP